MLADVDLKKHIKKSEFKEKVKPQKAKLEVLQRTIQKHNISVIVLIEGWEGCGKIKAIKHILEPLDPRNFDMYTTPVPDKGDMRYPFLKRYWDIIPKRGKILILDKGWYSDVYNALYTKNIEEKVLSRRIESINTFERQLADSKILVVKFFMHISRKKQRERLNEIKSDDAVSSFFSKKDIKQSEQYDEYYKKIDSLLKKTDTPHTPWHIISAEQSENAVTEIYDTLISEILSAVSKTEKGLPLYKPTENTSALYPYIKIEKAVSKPPPLHSVELNKSMSKSEYVKKLKDLQHRLYILCGIVYQRKIPVIIAYEGWDAAGKGGNIKRLSEALDPRAYSVVPIAAPDKNELAHHYLWRFWKSIPKNGHIAIFDRTWYGRVLVERVEGFCNQDEWSRAYNEINEFEAELYRWGAVIVKLWLHIDSDEQLRRFKQREATPEKRWKITDEDWRNREKWKQYEKAVDDMTAKTSTLYAPWTIVESNSKYFARIRVLETVIERIENALEAPIYK